MPVRPPIHRPVGRREKQERDRDYQSNRNPVARALYRSKRWRTERAAFLREHPLCVERKSHGELRPASVVDHADPHGGGTSRRSGTRAVGGRCARRATAGRRLLGMAASAMRGAAREAR